MCIHNESHFTLNFALLPNIALYTVGGYLGLLSVSERNKETIPFLIVMAHDLGLVDPFCHDVRASKEVKGTNLVNRETNK